MRINVELIPVGYDPQMQYSVCEWVSMLVSDMKQLNLPPSEEYEMGLRTWGEDMVCEYKDQFVYIVNNYIADRDFVDKWELIQYLFGLVQE